MSTDAEFDEPCGSRETAAPEPEVSVEAQSQLEPDAEAEFEPEVVVGEQARPVSVGEEQPPTGDALTAAEPAVAVAPEGPELRGAIEAILLVVDEPVTATVLAQVIAVPEAAVVEVLEQLRSDYDHSARGFELRQIGSGWRLYTRAEYAAYVERFVLDGQQARLTQAALETLAVVAYRQPVSRSRVSAVRGVNVDGVMRTLVSRGLVEEAGSEPESGAVLYRTSAYFLERLGLRDLSELPNLANYLPESTTIDQLEGQLSSEGRDV
jgi:segregation and condensation protein B